MSKYASKTVPKLSLNRPSDHIRSSQNQSVYGGELGHAAARLPASACPELRFDKFLHTRAAREPEPDGAARRAYLKLEVEKGAAQTLEW